jgi:hypothetical protein
MGTEEYGLTSRSTRMQRASSISSRRWSGCSPMSTKALLKICFDTGHSHSYAGFDPVAFMKRHMGRISYMHFKDIDPGVKADAVAKRTGFYDACGQGIFCNLGKGMTDFPCRAAAAARRRLQGWCTVEQDCDPTLAPRRPSTMRAPTAPTSNPSASIDGDTGHEQTDLGYDRRRRGQPDRPGAPHLARTRRRFEMKAGALDADPAKGRDYASGLGWRKTAAMATGRRCWRARPRRPLDLVTVATPNATHFAITKAFLEAGIHVLCEKPMTVTVEEGEDIAATAAHRRHLRGELRLHRLSAGAPHAGHGGGRARSGARCGSSSSNSPTATMPMRRMPTTRACAGAMIRHRPGSRASSPIAASMRCTWRASSATTRWNG